MRKLFVALLLTALPATAQNTAPNTPWRHPLYLDNGGYWNSRIKITASSIANIDGAAQPLTVGQNGLNLAGAEARSLRVLDDKNTELLFNITRADGAPRHEGKIENGDILTVPLELPANQTRALWIYWGNDKAGLVPDFLPNGFQNGNADKGQAPDPVGWRPEGGDDQHILRWTKTGRTGSGLYAEAKAGTAPSWFKWTQTGVPVAPGQEVQVEAWVKAEDTEGLVGWYVHVNGSKPQLVNKVINAGQGTYDWTKINLNFTVPEGGATLDIGTVLYGTGRAWFDDATLKISGNATNAAKLQIGPVETPASLFPIPDFALFGGGGNSDKAPFILPKVTVPIKVNNIGNNRKTALITADVRRALLISRLGDAPSWQLRYGMEKPLPANLKDGVLTFKGFLPSNTVRNFELWLGPKGKLTAGPALPESETVVGPLNRLQNASFETGGDLPEGWDLSAQQENGKPVGVAKRVRGGKDGDWAVQLTIPPDAKANWSGWHQFAPVEAGGKYLLGAWLKTQDSGGVQLNAHWRDENKQLVKQSPYTGAGPALNGTADWTWL